MSHRATEVLVGTAPTVTGVFTDIDGVATNPSAITFTVVTPARVATVYTAPHASIANPAVGTYVFTFPAGTTEVGSYWVYVRGTGNGVTVAEEVEIQSHRSHVPAA